MSDNKTSDIELARMAAAGMAIGVQVVIRACGLPLTDEQRKEGNDFLYKIAQGEETLAGSGAELRLIDPNITEEDRRRGNERIQKVAKMIIWFHSKSD